MVWLTSGAAQVASVIVPGATAALRYSATSGVESSQRLAYSAASCRLPLQTSFAQAARTNAVPERDVRPDGDDRCARPYAGDRRLGDDGRRRRDLQSSRARASARRSASMALDLRREAVVFVGLASASSVVAVVGRAVHDLAHARGHGRRACSRAAECVRRSVGLAIGRLLSRRQRARDAGQV